MWPCMIFQGSVFWKRGFTCCILYVLQGPWDFRLTPELGLGMGEYKDSYKVGWSWRHSVFLLLISQTSTSHLTMMIRALLLIFFVSVQFSDAIFGVSLGMSAKSVKSKNNCLWRSPVAAVTLSAATWRPKLDKSHTWGGSVSPYVDLKVHTKGAQSAWTIPAQRITWVQTKNCPLSNLSIPRSAVL